MTPLKFIVTFTLVIASCHAFPKRLSPDNQDFLSQLLSSKLLQTPHRLYPSHRGRYTAQNDDQSDDATFDDRNFGDDNSINNNNNNDDDDESNSVEDIQPSYPVAHQHLPNIFHGPGGESGSVSHLAPLFPSQDSLIPLRLLTLARSGVDVVDGGEGLVGVGARGKRFIPGFNSLLMARYLSNVAKARIVDAGKWKRQPHLGFHASRG